MGNRALSNIARRLRRVERAANRPPPALFGKGEVRPFKLTSNLEAMATAGCRPCEWNGQSEEWVVIAGSQELAIRDLAGQFYGLTDEILWGCLRATQIGAKSFIEARSHGAPTHEGKLDAALATGSSATMSIYTCATGSWVDTTVNLTVYAPPRIVTGSIAQAKWIRVYYELTRPGWTMDSAQC